MPTVPVYGNTQEQLRGLPDAAQRVQASGFADAAQPLLQAAQGGEELAYAFGQAAIRQQEQENLDQTQRGIVALGDRRRAFQSEAYARKGANAKGLTTEATKWWDEQLTEVLGTLENDFQRRAFTRIALRQRESFLNGISRHEAVEQRASVVESTRAAIGMYIQDAAANPFDSQATAASKQQLDASVRALGKLQGWTPEQLDAALTEQRTTLHTQVVKSLADRDPYAARAYYSEHRDEIAGTSHASIEHLLDQASVVGQSQAEADRIVSAGLTDEEQLAEARKISDPKLRDAVVSRVKVRQAEQDRLLRENQQQASEQAWTIVAAGQGIDAIPRTTWATLTGQEQIKLQQFMVKRASGAGMQTNWQTYYELKQQASDDPAAFAQENLYRYRGELGNTEFKQLVDLQTSAKSNPERTAQVRTSTRMVNDALIGMGIKPTATKGDQAERAVGFRRRVDEEIAGFEQAAGRKATRDEIQQIIDRLQINVIRERSWWPDKQTPAFESEIEGVPARYVDDIAARLQAGGVAVTAENIKRMYDAAVGDR